jgi:hypothetical protein
MGTFAFLPIALALLFGFLTLRKSEAGQNPARFSIMILFAGSMLLIVIGKEIFVSRMKSLPTNNLSRKKPNLKKTQLPNWKQKAYNMRNILIIGAGRSASSLIRYLLEKSATENLHVTIGDLSVELARKKTNGHPNATAIALDIFDENQRHAEIEKADIVISMLPAHLHIEVAKDCITYKKHMVTASYISDAMQSLDAAAKENNLIFMNEIGLDPGIDHMSAMKVIDEIRDNGGKMMLFESFCGGFVAPESDNNLWNYKFTWAPRNVVLAGNGGAAKFLQEGTYKYIPYHKLYSAVPSFSMSKITGVLKRMRTAIR